MGINMFPTLKSSCIQSDIFIEVITDVTFALFIPQSHSDIVKLRIMPLVLLKCE
jgi:hypothetical protein